MTFHAAAPVLLEHVMTRYERLFLPCGTPDAKSEKVVSFGNFLQDGGATRPNKYLVPRCHETVAGGREHLGSPLSCGKEIFRNRKWTSEAVPPSPVFLAHRRGCPHVRRGRARDEECELFLSFSLSLSYSLTHENVWLVRLLYSEVFPTSVPRNLGSGIRMGKGKQIVWKDETVLMDS